jgi:hypothetical protein
MRFLQGLLPRDWNAPARLAAGNSCAGLIGITLRDQIRNAKLTANDLDALHEFVRTGRREELQGVMSFKISTLTALAGQLKAVQIAMGEPLMPGDLLIHRHLIDEDGEAWIVHDYDMFYKSARVINPFGVGIPEGGSGGGIARLKTFNLLEDTHGVSEFGANLSPARLKDGVFALRLKREALAEDCSTAIKTLQAQNRAADLGAGPRRSPAASPNPAAGYPVHPKDSAL